MIIIIMWICSVAKGYLWCIWTSKSEFPVLQPEIEGQTLACICDKHMSHLTNWFN